MKNLFLFLFVSIICLAQENIPYKDKTLPVESRVDDLLKRMTLDEKIDLLGGTGFATKKNDRLGIPELRMTDGPVGARWGNSTAFPVSIASAATWNPEYAGEVGSAIGRETKGHGRHVILGPCVNIARLPMGGRNFESYGEDPFLASRMAVAYIKGVQKEDVAATVKHFAVNNQEYERGFTDVLISNRALNEIYLPTFKAAVTEADVLCVMCSYNKVNLHFASENDYLLKEKLKKEWGFKNLVMSDWGAVHSSIPVANGGLDLEMPTGRFLNKETLQGAIDSGTIPLATIEDKVKRILTVIFKLGLFDNPVREENKSLINSSENKKVALETSEASIVLLKNDQNILPLDKNNIRTVAVIGPSAAEAKTGGGGSAFVTAIDPVAPLAGLKDKLPSNIKIEYAKGVEFDEQIKQIESGNLFTDSTQKKNGLNAEYFDNINLSGTPKYKQIDKEINFKWEENGPSNGIGKVNYSVRWTGFLKAQTSGEVVLNIMTDDGARLWIDGKLVFEDWTRHAATKQSVVVKMEEGKLYKIKMEYFQDLGGATAILGWKSGKENLLTDAVELAKKSDCVLLFVGNSSNVETEGRDRDNLILPQGQDELISKVAEANKNVVVVLTSGSPVLMDNWINKVKGVVEMWFAGSQGGNAIADVLLGNYNPSGKLPVTFPKRWEDCSAYPTYKKLEAREYYSDDIYVGYRYFDKNNIEPLFPFGYGLSYTTFEYSNLSVSKSGDGFEVKFEIKNTGKIKGGEAAQLYISSNNASVDHPVKELKGFSKIVLNQGESAEIKLNLNRDDFAYFSEELNSWKVDEGTYGILIGSSSRDIKLNTTVTVK
jgi:beta-glucosidase